MIFVPEWRTVFFMVNFKKLGYELNHIYRDALSNPVVAIGARTSLQTTTRTLFEKSLALTSDLKKLPILRSLFCDLKLYATFLASLIASGWAGMYFTITVYDGAIDVDKIIAQAHGNFFYHANGIVYNKPQFVWPYLGGYLLHDKMIITMDVVANQNAAGTAFPIDQVIGIINSEIDWCEINQADFKDYILENVYSEG
jgi:hypothetical protein